MQKRHALLALILIILPLASAQVINVDFVSPQAEAGELHINTNIEITPALGTLQPSYCSGATIQVPININPRYYPSSAYDAHLGNTIQSQSQANSCLTPYNSVNTGKAINWLSASEYSGSVAKDSIPIYRYNEFAALMGSLPQSQFTQRAAYYSASDGHDFTGGPYQSEGGMFCKGSIAFSASTPANFQTIVTTYRGEATITPSVTLPTVTTPTQITLQSRFDLAGCTASGKTIFTGGCPAQPQVWLYRNGFSSQMPSGTATITVLPTFDCTKVVASPTQQPPNPVTQGVPFQVGFSVTNNGNIQISLNPNSITVSSGFTKQSISPSTVQQIQPSQTVQFTAMVVANNPGNGQTLTFTIPSTVTDCAGTKTCTATALFTVNVQTGGGNPTKCDPLVIQGHSSTFTPTGDFADITATCRDASNNIVACPTMDWTTAIDKSGGGFLAMNPASTSPPAASQSRLTVPTGTPVPQDNKFVKARARTEGFECQVLVNVHSGGGGGVPVRCDLSGVPVTIPQGGSATAVATCFDANNFVVPCQQLSWTTTIQPATMNPATTNSPPNPSQSVLNVPLTTPTQQNREVRASSTLFPPCFKPIAVVAGGGGIARSCLLSSVPSGPDFASPSTVALTATCKDTANPIDPNAQNVACPPMRWQQTVASGVTLPSSTSGGTNTMSIAAGVSAVFPQTITTTSNDPAINPPFSCTEQFSIGQGSGGGNLRITACDVDKPLYQPGESGVARAHCTDASGAPVDCPQLAWSAPNSPNYVNLAPPPITDPAPTPVRKDFTISSNALPTPPQFISIRCNNPSDCDPAFSQCPSPLQVNIGSGGDEPDYIAIVTPVTNYYEFGQTAVITVVTKNMGAGPTAESSTTLITDDNGCAADPHIVGGIGSDSHDYRCSCSESTYGLHVITAVADETRQIDESNENNNEGNNIFYCCPAGGCQPLACFDYF